MRLAIALSVLSAAAIGAAWAWLGAPVAMPNSPLGAGDKLYCISYAPFRHSQSPLDPSAFQISAAQIEEDIVRLARLTDCVRTYSVDFGLDQVPEIASRHGVQVIQGLWLSGQPEKNRYQTATAIALANKYPNTIRAVVVGNEVLLRGEMSAADLASTMRSVKARVPVPVTYADVWEFWLRNPVVASAADFITIHILPYWEDDPIAASSAAAHVASIYQRVVQAFPGKEIIIGEVGWPSAGRMREGALPSPSNQARVIQDVLAFAKRDNVRVNVIEAFDQPWKRALEGTVGGHWGLLDDGSRSFKFSWGAPVSDHQYWIRQALTGIAFAGLIFFSAARVRRDEAPLARWIGVTVIAIAGGVTIGWAVENASYESFGAGGIARSLALIAVALLAPPFAAGALIAGRDTPQFAQVLSEGRSLDRATRALGWVMVAATVLAVMIALGLAFDPRYRDFPFAPLTAALVPFFVLAVARGAPARPRGVAEMLAAATVVLCAAFTLWNETLANWQSVWFCSLMAMLAVILLRARGARS
jgi:glucan 1,3-beta-glucosidase